jgi:hypothetical protein
MEQLVNSTKDFDIFGAELWHRQGERRKFKSRSDFSQMRHSETRNCFFRCMFI